MPLWWWLAAVGAWEGAWWLRRRSARADAYRRALEESRRTGLPLVVVGAPDLGATSGYGCGDVTIDARRSACPGSMVADVRRLPLPDDSCVAFVSCVLEYVDRPWDALRELLRVSGGRLHVVGVEPWTLAAWLYPDTVSPSAGWWASRCLEYRGEKAKTWPR